MDSKADELSDVLASSEPDLNKVIDDYELIEAQYISAYQTAPVLPATTSTTDLPISSTFASSSTP